MYLYIEAPKPKAQNRFYVCKLTLWRRRQLGATHQQTNC